MHGDDDSWEDGAMELSGKKVAVLAEDNYENLELWYPVLRFREAGAHVTIVGPKSGESYKSKEGYPAKADMSMEDAWRPTRRGHRARWVRAGPDAPARGDACGSSVRCSARARWWRRSAMRRGYRSQPGF